MEITEYKHTDGARRWEFSYEGVFLVLLQEDAPKPYANQLLAFEPFGKLLWVVNPATQQEHDYIINVWVKNGSPYAGSFAGYDLKVNLENGDVIETKFTK
ncbi:hypothetical protein KIJ96_21445 (plasmid) [Pseudoalteromonas piscicida]|uniref:hypothetical protein n=1 Tax=Pseudoalteromonas piscicida TaxID=43662 RepID=UPI001D0B7C20|nr:hypothetical protein [Pseudoalteromonas piscicida]UDM63524.1 hypothetical protein KIJ96_21445 [Pseudoalteromonas piscicida]